MKVLMVSVATSNVPGGVGNVKRELGHRLRQLGVDVDFLYGKDPLGRFYSYLDKVPKALRLFDPILGAVLLRRFLRNRKYDVIHCHGIHAIYDLMLARKLFGVNETRAVITLHGVEHSVYAELVKELSSSPFIPRSKGFAYKMYHRLNMWRERFSYQQADAIISVSTGVQRDLKNYLGLQSVVIPNGVSQGDWSRSGLPGQESVRERYGLGVTDIVVLFVGGSNWIKGLHYLLPALSQAGERYKVVAPGAREKSYDSVPILSVPFAPPQLLRQLYHMSDIFCQPSLYEAGAALAVLEAMCFGLSCVVSDVAGIEDVVQDGVNGLVTRRRNVEALASALKQLADARLRAELGQRGLETTRELTWEMGARKTLEIYQEILG